MVVILAIYLVLVWLQFFKLKLIRRTGWLGTVAVLIGASSTGRSTAISTSTSTNLMNKGYTGAPSRGY